LPEDARDLRLALEEKDARIGVEEPDQETIAAAHRGDVRKRRGIEEAGIIHGSEGYYRTVRGDESAPLIHRST
jgi:hypothetical protein